MAGRLPLQHGGESEQQQDTFVEFGSALLLSVVLMYMLLVALYESLLYPLIVLFALPLALVGAMGGLAIRRETLNLFSLIGVIMLTGLVGRTPSWWWTSPTTCAGRASTGGRRCSRPARRACAPS